MSTAEAKDYSELEIVAESRGLKVPQSRFLSEQRIKRIENGRYEGDEINGALSVVTETDRVLEIGAGLGIVGATIALNAKPEKVLSFEANPALMETIQTLYDLNGLNDRIEVRNEVLALGDDRPDTITLYLTNSFLGSSLMSEVGRVRHSVDVPTADLAQVIAEFAPTVLIMDIEGGELALLEEMDLSGFRAMTIEFHPKAYDISGMRRCKSIIRDAGFNRIDELSNRLVWTCEKSDDRHSDPA